MESSSPPPAQGAHAGSARPSASEDLGLSPHRGDEALDRLLVLLARMSAAPSAALCIDDQGRQFLGAAFGVKERALVQRSPLVDRALQQSGILLVADASQDPELAGDPFVAGPVGLRSFAGVAVRGLDRQRVGVLCVMDSAPNSFDEHACGALRELRVLVEDRLRLRADALHDPTTGAITRRHFDEIADREWRRAMRALAPISVIVCELDRVHDFTASEGLQALDRGLRASVLAMQYSMHRPGDYVCRYDDTRLVLLLPGTDESGAVETAERVRHAVEGLLIPFAGAADSKLTLSAGVTTIHSEALSRGDLGSAVHAATAALRDAQQAGGNRWMIAGANGELMLPS